MDLAREQQMLLRCVRAAVCGHPPGEDDLGRVDWSEVCALAGRHQVVGLVYDTLVQWVAQGRLPRHVEDPLRLPCHLTAVRNEGIRRRVVEILRESGRRGIEVMLLKGAVLAYTVYAHPRHRAMADVDLLVREHDFLSFRSILEGLGYRTSLPCLGPRELPRYAHCFRQVRFQAAAGPPIEVHFRLLNMGMPGAVESGWDDASRFELDGVEARSPSPERFLLHLCLHAQQHAFAMLRLLVDVAVWYTSRPIDPERFVALAHRYYLPTSAFYALTYTADLLGLPHSECLRRQLEPPAWRKRLFDYLLHDREVRALQAGCRPPETELPWVFLLSGAPVRQKALFAWNVLLPPAGWLVGADGRWDRARWRYVKRILGGLGQACCGTRAAPQQWPGQSDRS